MDEKPVDDALASLQSLLMEQQRAMETLAEQVLAHERRFSDMARRLDVLEQRLEMILELGGAGASGGADDKPPHY